MKICPHCAEEIQDAALVCPHCRKKQPLSAEAAERRNTRWVIGGIVALVFAGLLLADYISTEAKNDRAICENAMNRGSGLTVGECVELIRKNGREAVLPFLR